MLALLLLAATASFDLDFAHVPEWLEARAKPEQTLHGISLHEPIGAVKKRLGKPESVKPGEDVYATYVWRGREIVIEVETIGSAKKEQVLSVTVKSDGPEADAKTSRGVHLGGTLDDLIRAYGSRYHIEYDKSYPDGLAVIFTFSDESQVRAVVNDEGRIIALEIMESLD